MHFYNDHARAAYEEKKGQAARELAALRERMPEQLPKAYKLTLLDECSKRTTTLCTSDRLSTFHANAGVDADTVRRMTETGRARKVWNGWIKIVPVEGVGDCNA